MATYYISNSGNDSTGNGLSVGTAWATFSKAFSTITASGSGDTLYVAPGLYRGNAVLNVTPSSSSPFSIIGDVTGSVFGVSPGLVEWRAWTNDTTPQAVDLLKATTKTYVTLKNLKLVAGNGACLMLLTDCTNWTIQDCTMVANMNNQCIFYSGTTGGLAWNSTIERCDLIASTNNAVILFVPQHTAEYSINAVMRNCRLFSRSSALVVQAGGTGSFLGTGFTVQNCGFYWANVAVAIYSAAAINLTTPIGIYGSYTFGAQTGFIANNNTQVVEDGNVILAQTVRTNVNVGANSITTACPAFSFNDERLTGQAPRPFFEPSATSPFLAFGNYGTAPTVDLWNQSRPATVSSGPLERDTFSSGTVINIFQSEG